MAASRASRSPTPVESTETNGAPVAQESSSMTEDECRAMKAIIETLYNHRTPEGHDPSKVFHRKVNKRAIPEYYEVIKEPIALSTLKAKLSSREYKTSAEFVRDCALMIHNAQTFNLPTAGAYVDALTLKAIMEAEFQKLADQNIILPEVAVLPDLGEIPPADPQPPEEEEEEDDEDEDEDDEDDEADESEEEGGRRKRKRGPRSTAAISKREGGSKDDSGQKGNDTESRKKRGRPPRVDTPMEARIKAVLKGLRKFKNDVGQIMIHHFEKVPDKIAMPEYYAEIKEPMSIEIIKKKQKRKKYQSVDHFMRDVDIMFNNAKMYNEDESQIYKDAVKLQKEAHDIADREKKKPDAEFVMEEGRLPLPNGILHNGEVWQVGDWVHIQNANDVTKPIVAQIYRTWQDAEGLQWVNACWYYRPEQTVHQYEKHFYPNEVVKTGQYRDHQIDEIIDRCFVMFFTRYSRGRPRKLAADKEVYVCEARYNEEKYKLNKIKTWASCLPDEVRDQDYEMDLFDGLRKVKKVPSPILHLLKEDAKEADEISKPRWGAANAPPIVGAVYKGPRDENQSPPPEPTPSPPPQLPPPPVRQVSNVSNQETGSYRRNSELDVNMSGTTPHQNMSAPTPSQGNPTQSTYNTQQAQQYHQHSASPAPVHQYAPQASTYTPQMQHSAFVPPQQSSHANQYSAPATGYGYQQTTARNSLATGAGYNPPRPTEVYHLGDSANNSIPEDIRELFHRDDQGHVLFFTSPPLDVLPPDTPGAALGHSVKYRAARLRRNMLMRLHRKAGEEAEAEDDTPRKKAKQEEGEKYQAQLDDMATKALHLWIQQMDQGTDRLWQSVYGDDWEEAKRLGDAERARVQKEHQEKAAVVEENARKRKTREHISLKDPDVFLDDLDPRY